VIADMEHGTHTHGIDETETDLYAISDLLSDPSVSGPFEPRKRMCAKKPDW